MGTPRAGPDSCHSGSQCAGTVLDGDYGTEADSRFISPSVVLPAVMDKQEIHLRFWQLIYKNKGNKGSGNGSLIPTKMLVMFRSLFTMRQRVSGQTGPLLAVQYPRLPRPGH